MDGTAIEKFVTYLRIKTVQPNPDYESAKQFLLKYADEIGLPAKVVELNPGTPFVIMTWQGSQQDQSGSILFSSHIDVVPVEEDKWTYPPFEARRVDGKIYARGSQDMKVIGVQYLEAVRRLKAAGFNPKRTVHFIFTPDEETGGPHGMCSFVYAREFKELNVAFAVDEGIPSPADELSVYYAERSIWWIPVTFKGTPGHGSMLKNDTAGEKLWRFMDKLMRFRDSQLLKYTLTYEKEQRMGEMLSVNLTMLEGGKQPNVIPSELKAVFDIRVPPTVDLAAFEQSLLKWGREAAVESGGEPESVIVDTERPFKFHSITDLTTEQAAPFWKAFSHALDGLSIKHQLAVFLGGTDCRNIRRVGIPAVGFSALPRTPFLLHDHDEHVEEGVFLQGIQIYQEIIKKLSSV